MIIQLTPRQDELMGLLVQGISNPEIAERMHISESTVKATLDNIKNKMPADVLNTRTAMAVWYVEWQYTVLRGCAEAVVKDPSGSNIKTLKEALDRAGMSRV